MHIEFRVVCNMDSFSHKAGNSVSTHGNNVTQSGKDEEQDIKDDNSAHSLREDGSRLRGNGREYELRKLSFKNPGKLMEDIKPEKSDRELRKVNRKSYKRKPLKTQLYDDSGISLENNEDMCDCLEANCPGCHFACPKCGSEKCGTECRCNRKWTFEYVHVEGTKVILKWPT